MSAPGTRNPFGHIDLRVPSIAEALPFYEALLPALGFTRRYDGGDWRVFATELPYIPLLVPNDVWVHSIRVRGWRPFQANPPTPDASNG